ncbi:hypothetical protein BH20ACT20_BH20ACT20_02200 [soil metagenome]|jgi:hypothetical protein|nr:DUF2795 domain-containing protein [Actinomycetota bacterium]MDQ3433231.1 DUF2795 domain-containing protein [Actinomycetota bacterium]
MRETPLEASLKYVNGVTWPINKAELLEAMQRNGAPDDVLQNVRSAPVARFVSPTDIHMALRSLA